MGPSLLLAVIAILLAVAADDCLGFTTFPIHGKPPVVHQRYMKYARKDKLPPLTGGDNTGAYYVELQLGTPPQTIRVDPDTGSSVFGVVSPVCGCSYYGSGFKPSNSSSAIASTCGYVSSACPNLRTPVEVVSTCTECCDSSSVRYCSTVGTCGRCAESIRYGDGSSAFGLFFKDLVNVGPTPGSRTPVYFASITGVTGRFTGLGRDDGILGLAYASLSPGVPTFMDSLKAAGVADEFSFCFGRADGGRMMIGGLDDAVVDSQSHDAFDVHVAIDSSTGFYGVWPAAFSMGCDDDTTNQHLVLPPTRAIVDTGTTLLYTNNEQLASSITQWIVREVQALNDTNAAYWVQQMIAHNAVCIPVTQLGFLNCLPHLYVSMCDAVTGNATKIPIPATSYFLIQASQYCLYSDLSVSIAIEYQPLGGIDMILGDVFLRNVVSTFNRTSSLLRLQKPHSQLCGSDLTILPNSTCSSSRHHSCASSTPSFAVGCSLPWPLYVWAVIAVGVVVAIVVAIIIIACLCRKRKAQQVMYQQIPQIAV